MADKSVDKLFAEILKDYKAVASEAIENAAKLAQDDIYEYAYGCLGRYYNNYQPKMYKRKNNLIKSIVPIFECNSTRRKISFTIGVEYDSSKLEGLYKSNSYFHQSGDRWIPTGYQWVWSPQGEQRRFRNLIDEQEESEVLSTSYGVPDPGWILNNYLFGIHPWGKLYGGKNGPHKKDSKTTFSSMKKYFQGKEITNNITGHIQDELFNVVVSRVQKG